MSNFPPDDSGTNGPVEQPVDFERYALPLVDVDPVVRMRALVAGLPHVAANETVFDRPFERVWNLLTDFEHGTPEFEGLVGRARVLSRRDDPRPDRNESTIVLETQGPIPGPWIRFDVVLQPGWCLMSSRLGQVGMAARPEHDASTRFFHFEGSGLLGALARPFFAWNIRQDFRRLRHLLG